MALSPTIAPRRPLPQALSGTAPTAAESHAGSSTPWPRVAAAYSSGAAPGRPRCGSRAVADGSGRGQPGLRSRQGQGVPGRAPEYQKRPGWQVRPRRTAGPRSVLGARRSFGQTRELGRIQGQAGRLRAISPRFRQNNNVTAWKIVCSYFVSTGVADQSALIIGLPWLLQTVWVWHYGTTLPQRTAATTARRAWQ